MDTKALKKQMGAAIAMVLVAAIALGSATFAWFVTNNTVKATTSSVSAQSNASFMTIEYNASAVGGNKTSATAGTADTKLYPATFGEQSGATKGTFMTGYGTNTDTPDLKGDLETVGTPDQADAKEFAKKLVFNVSSRGKALTNLRVASVEAKDQDDNLTTNESEINSALRLLVKCGDKWVVLDGSGNFKLGSDGITTKDGVLSLAVAADKDTEVDIYLFYEGSDKNVYTNNLDKLTASSQVTVSFTADSGNVTKSSN